MQDIRISLRRFMIDTFLFGTGVISDDESLVGSGVIDSTGVLELVAFLESEYGITLGDAELTPANLDTLNGIVGLVEAKTGARAPSADREPVSTPGFAIR